MIRSDLLDHAQAKVCAKSDDYGHPEDSFALISGLWGQYLNVSVTPEDVAMMMVLLKVARVRGGKDRQDSLVDIAGYAACAAELGGVDDGEKELDQG